jgi:cysteinyl-tRNA synthetase
MPREIRLTNTATGKKERLETLAPGKLTMYSCGPTVYNFIHIGNLRGGVVADLFFRYFKRAGYDVNYVRNYTDVDDKIIARAKEEGMAPEALARKYTGEVERDYAVAGMLEPTHKTTVTDHVREIIAMIEAIVRNGKGYVADDGEVLFSIDAFPTYGALSRRNLEDQIAGHRVEVSSKKRNPLDFTLWKPAKPGEPAWDSPWGKGRPGWHIECSAMASKWLGNRIDVHHGGEDLVFPHHENEIAQSEAATGEAPFVHHWLHHAFVNLGKEKMSKSLGNVFLARKFLEQYGGEVARYLLLSAHYRSIIEFDADAVEQALSGLQRIYEAKAKALELAARRAALPDLRAESLWSNFVAEAEKVKRDIDDAYANDFNTPGALAALFGLIREFNRIQGEPMALAAPASILAAQSLIQVIEDDIGGVLGVGRLDPRKALEDIARIRAAKPTESGAARPSAEEIEAALKARVEARARKDFAEADRIRKDLEARGVALKDGPQGTKWEYR